MLHHVYILLSGKNNKWSYVGSTSNLDQRIKDHNNGKTISTKGFRLLKLVYTENYESRQKAYQREKYLKSGIGREEKEKIISVLSRIV